jgi:hypothetical protein
MPATVPDYLVVPEMGAELRQLVEARFPPNLPATEPLLGAPARRSFGPRELAVKGAAARRRDG